MIFALVFGFLVGVVAVLALEGLGLYWVVQRSSKKKVGEVESDRGLCVEQQAFDYPCEKQGVLWILDQERLPNINLDPEIKETKESSNKKVVEVLPVKMTAKIKEHSLILIGLDGVEACIPLLDCSILAVSSSDLPSRKWYKKYPIMIESRETAIYKGQKTCYLYFETSSEKESWCKALRLSSYSDKAKITSYAELQEGFNSYLASLAAEHPLFQKPSVILAGSIDKSIKIDESSSRVRHILKKVAKKAARLNIDSLSTRAEKRAGDKSKNSLDASSISSSTKSASSEKPSSLDVVPPTSPRSALNSDSRLNESVGPDDGALCLNMLLARLFYDAKRSKEINNLITARLQKTLSNMRTPNFIGGITCTGLNVGNLPPYIHHMRTLPVDMKEMCALEVDIEYKGGFVLEIETRLEVCEPEFQGIVDTSLEQSSAEEVTSGLLEDFESYSNQLKFKTCSSVKNDKQDEDKNDGLRQTKSGSWTSTYKSRWKTIVNSIAGHVSQVPIALAVKVASLRGTLCLRVKPPPSDQIWYGFTSMPEIEFSLDSSFGDHKISSTHVALIIANRLKVAIRESLVLPNCESICIPWMSAEKDDWVPRSVAPYIWLRQENTDMSRKNPVNSLVTTDLKSKSDSSHMKGFISSEYLNDMEDKKTTDVLVQQPHKESVGSSLGFEMDSTSFSSDDLCSRNVLEELKIPLLENHDGDGQVSRSRNVPELLDSPSISSSMETMPSVLPLPEDSKEKKYGRRAKMLDFGKRMGEKLEEKRRHIEEKGRHMVEKLRENSRVGSEGSSSSFGGSFRS